MAVLIDTGKIGVVINWIRTFCPEQEAKIITIVEEGGADREIMEKINSLLDGAVQRQQQAKPRARSAGG